MKKLFFALFIFLNLSLLFGQQNEFTDAQFDSLYLDEERNAHCMYYNSGIKIENAFPFNSSDRIELVAFSNRDMAIDKIVDNGKLLLKTIKQKKNLLKQDIDTLFDKLYNRRSYRDLKENILTTEWISCYMPHHAIIFYKKKKPIAFIEICFKCSSYKISHYNMLFGDCTEKFDYFKTLFEKNGLTYMLE